MQLYTSYYSLFLVFPVLLLYGCVNPHPVLQLVHHPVRLLCIGLNVFCFTFLPACVQLRIGEEPLEETDLPRAPNQSATLKRKMDTALFTTAFVGANLLHYVYHHHAYVFVTPELEAHHAAHHLAGR